MKLMIPVLLLSACMNSEQPPSGTPVDTKKSEFVKCPDFNEDSAYFFIRKQVDFGPRIPGTQVHEEASDWLMQKLERYADKVELQEGQVKLYNGETMTAKNIIAVFNPESSKRILLCAHYDTRPFSDQDEEFPSKPFDGANDGGSGTAVLLEIARLISIDPLKTGVDIILFDVEDYGQPEFVTPNRSNTYCLGSQYWAKNPHSNSYHARFGILLDMVGASTATFPREGISMQYASGIVTKVWDVAHKLGYGRYFEYTLADPITDDHLYINSIKGIPTIDIVHLDKKNNYSFGDFWHTQEDNMSIIDKNTLKAVGQTVVQVIYNFSGSGEIKPS